MSVIDVRSPLRAGPYTLFRGVPESGAQRAPSTTFYVLADAPRLALDADGAPAIRVTRYLRADGTAWGFLELTLDLGWPDADEGMLRAAAVASLDAAVLPPGALPAAVRLAPMPAHDGTIFLSALGDGPSTEDGGRIVSAAEFAAIGARRASFVVELSGEDAAMLLASLRADAPALFTRWDLVVQHRMDAIRMRVWADVSGFDVGTDPDAAVEHLLARSLGGVEFEAGPGEALGEVDQQALHERGLDLLRRFVEEASQGEQGGQGEPASASLNVEWTGDALMDRTISVSGLVTVALSPEQAAARLRDVHAAPGFFDVTEVRVLVPPWSEDIPVSSVQLHLSHATGASHDRQFGAEGGEVLFRAHARTAEDQFASAQATVRYDRGADPWEPEPFRLESGERWVVNSATLGVFSVRAVLGRLHDLVGARAEVELEVPSVSARHVVLLDEEQSEAIWHVPVGGADTRTARARVTWHLAGSGTLPGQWQPLSSGRLLLDAPAPTTSWTDVVLMSAGSFAGLQSLVVEVRASDLGAGTEPDAVLSFTSPGEERVVRIRSSAPGPTPYRLRQTFVYDDGTRRTEGWRDETARLKVVRDRTLFTVQIEPRLLDLGGALRAAIVELRYDDPETGLSSQRNLVFRSRDDRSQWEFRLGAEDRRTWRWRVTFVDSELRKTTTEWADNREEVLILTPPSAEPPVS